MRLLKSAVLLLAVGSLFLNGCSRRSEPPMTRALNAAEKGEWLKADKPSEEAVRLTPDNVNALIRRALVCERLGRYDEAVENAYRAVGIDSNSFLPLYTLGRLYAARPDRRSDAVNLLIKAYRLKGDHPATLILLCNLNKPGSKYSYLTALSRLPGFEKDPELIFETLMDRVFRGSRKNVPEALQKLFDENPDNPGLTYAIGNYFFYCGGAAKRSAARAAYRRYLAFPEKQRTEKRTAGAVKRLAVLK